MKEHGAGMSEQWYYHQEGQTRGPHSLSELQAMLARGVLQPDTSVIRTGMKDWQPLQSQLATPPPLPRKSSAPQNAKPQMPAARPRRLPPARSRSWLPMAALAACALLLVGGATALAVYGLSNGAITPGGAAVRQPVETLMAEEVEEVEEVSSEPLVDVAADPALVEPPGASEFTAAPPLALRDVEESPMPEPFEEPAFKPSPPLPARPEPPPTSPEERPQPRPVQAAKIVLQQQEAGELYQSLDIHRQPTMSMPGAGAMTQDIRYQILSHLKVGEVDDRGLREVSQHVIDTRLVQADASSKASFTKALQDLKGWQFSYTIDRRGEVVEIRTPKTGARVNEVNPAGGKGILMTSVMDQDGWKELAALSFFNPRDENLEKQSWKRQMTHNFQPLGSWEGETLYERAGAPQQVMQINYQHDLRYQAPAAGIALEGVPLKIAGAEFKAEEARGSIYFNRDTRRVQSAEERFHVRGQLTADLLGQNLAIPVEEKQHIRLDISQENPWEQEGFLQRER